MVGTNVRITHLLTSFALCFFRAVLFILMRPFPIMAKKALTFIIIVATLACLAEMIRFFYGMISSPEKISFFRVFATFLSLIGWLCVCWEEIRRQRISNWIIDFSKKLKQHS